jgi:proteasome lid subunit RPN8/RPN11
LEAFQVQQTKFQSLIQALHNHSVSEYPREACGIVTRSFEYIPCKNISATPKTSFIVDPLAILQHEKDIWGFFHSHPGSADPIPSKRDLESTVFSEFRFLVGFAGAVYIYWLNEANSLSFEKFNENHCSL